MPYPKGLIVRFALLLAMILVVLPIGCAPTISPQAMQNIQKDKDQAAVKTEQAKEASGLALTKLQGKHLIDDENGKNAPATHPIAAINLVVKRVEPISLTIAVISSILFAVVFGLSKTPYTLFNGLIPFFRWVSVLSWSAVIALLFMPAGIFVIVLALIGLVSYELIKDKGDPEEAVDDTEALLGVKPSFNVSSVTPTKA